ncbi:cytochrome c oxidase subunit II [Isoalcanivorax pacificus W11-5]|uniref:Cytochrome c oxidase subunit 2 n=1 Tax=Isoalcanivorax pacificus W11-5 TaxID=391936 RepID=A0A0B4XS53_9GAMM|nr:cytochrome c oxidase subunit II [Isoalcanivorax pacificus]AJD49087.1 cytochrome c oxidase subunit II [Isoalcanivorax pacificus W11-5]
MQSTLFHRAAALLTTLMLSGVAAADWTQRSAENMRPGVTALSQEVYSLHMIILWICTAIGLLVFGLIMWSVFAHRKSKNPVPAKFHENVVLEVVWTIIPFFILIGMAIPATRVLIQMDDSSEAELTVKVTGSQWKWHYEYLAYEDDNNIHVGFFSNLATKPELWERPVLNGGLFPIGTAQERVGAEREPLSTDNENAFNYMLEVDNKLILPAGQKVRFLVTADDVIHSFWVPDFSVKKDAIPGFVNETWAEIPEDATGLYRGQCAELCGRLHAFMPIVVEVLPQEEFAAWLNEQKEAAASGPDMTPFASMEEAMEMGQGIYQRSCAMCHGAEGQGGIGLSFQGSDLMNNPDRRQENIDILINGRGAMPSFRAQLSPKEIAAVITYQRHSFGNSGGDLIQPEDVKK